MATTPTGTNLNGYEVKYWNRQTEADGDIMSQQTIMPICSAIQANRDDIDTMKAATDVINVYGTYSAFETKSGEMVEAGYLTDYDIVKVLQDEEHDDMQTYWQCHKEGDVWTWDYVGDLAPYYSKTEINDISASLSGTISSNYYASGNVTTAGKNLSATQTAVNGAPKVEISIKDKVEFVTVSATEKVSAKSGLITDLSAEHIHIDSVSNDDWYNVALYSADAKKFFHDSDFKIRYNPDKNTLSSINYTCTNITGTSAKFTNISGANVSATNLSSTTISASELSSTKISATNLSATNISAANLSSTNVSATNLSATNVSAQFISGTSAKFDGYSGTNISGDGKNASIKNLIISAEGGSAANAWLDTNSKKYISAISSNNLDNANINCTITTAYDGSATTAKIALSGYKTYFSLNDYVETASTQSDYTFQYQLTNKAISYMNQGHEASAWIDSGDYVKHTETGLKIGSTATLATVNAATALGKNASAENLSYVIGFGENSELSSYAANKGFAVGDSNYAVYNSYVLGWGNSADNNGNTSNQNRFILGISNSSNATDTFTIGVRNKTSMENSFIMGIGNNLSNNTSLPYKIILGAYSQSTGQSNNNLFAIGNGTSTKSKDIFNLSNIYLTYITENDYTTRISSAGIRFTIPDGTTNPPIAKTIPNKFIQGLSFLEPEYCNSAAADINADICLIFGDNASAGYAPNTGSDFSANRISLYFDALCPSKRFRLYPTIASAYSLCIGLNSNIKDVYIRGFGPMRYPGDGQDPVTGTGIDNVYFISSGWGNTGWPDLREGWAPNTAGATAIPNDNFYYNATQSTYLYIRRIALNRYIDITYDRLSNVFVMIKGVESSKLYYPTTD